IKALVPERATGELARAVLERSEGVPYYVEELLKTAVDEADAGADRLPLPRTVRDSVQMRLARLMGERGRPIADLLEAAAIAAIPLGYDVLLDLSGRGDRDTSEDLAAAVEAQLLERTPKQQEVYKYVQAITNDAHGIVVAGSRT